MHTHPFFMDHFPCVMKLCIDGILKSMVCVVNCSLSNEDNSHWYFVVFFSIVKVFFPCSHYYYGTFFYSPCKSHFFPIYLFFGKLGRVQGNNGGRGRKLVLLAVWFARIDIEHLLLSVLWSARLSKVKWKSKHNAFFCVLKLKTIWWWNILCNTILYQNS